MVHKNKQKKKNAPKVGGDNIICVSYFGFPEKMDKQAPEAREIIERELLGKWSARGVSVHAVGTNECIILRRMLVQAAGLIATILKCR